MSTFKHSGDLGDIIYALPTVKALGGGLLYLDVNGGSSDPQCRKYCGWRGRTMFTAQGYETIYPLLIEQPYIEDVRIWNGERVEYSLDAFRAQGIIEPPSNLATQHLRAFGLDETLQESPWLTLQAPPLSLHRTIILNRTVRYHSRYDWWELMLPQIAPRAVFLGHAKEHEIFEYTFRQRVEFYRTRDALEIARVLAGSELLIGNQSFIMAIAIGLGTAFIQEKYTRAPNCVFRRGNAQYI